MLALLRFGVSLLLALLCIPAFGWLLLVCADFVGLDEATRDADLILVLCDHNEFTALDYDLICKNMKNPVIFDTKNIIKAVPSEIKLFNYGNLFELN